MNSNGQNTKEQAVTRAIILLKAAGAQYKIVVGGEVVEDTLPHAEEANGKKKRKLVNAYGTLIKHIRPYLDESKKGECTYIPYGEFTASRISGSVTAYAARTWGNGSVIVHRDHAKKVVEVLRVL